MQITEKNLNKMFKMKIGYCDYLSILALDRSLILADIFSFTFDNIGYVVYDEITMLKNLKFIC